MQDLIINLAPTGMVPTRAQTPHVPLSPAEIAQDVARCAALGVSMAHLHARDADGNPSSDPALFAEIICRVREKTPDMIVISTTSGRQEGSVEKRAASLYLEGQAKPDMASLTLASMNFANSASVNAPQTVQTLARIMHERGIKPELEVFDLGMVNYAKVLIDKGLLQAPFYFNILLGSPATAQASLLHLAAIVADLPPQSIWSVAGIGRFQLRANGLGAVMADGVRVGLEDNLWLDDARQHLATNLQMVQRAVAQAHAMGRGVASCAEVRRRLNLERAV
ncbi:3-keto-5-aminohexanoate cleavage protein [Massilia sp. W12]|uniref:3-keto-5-aminohexanoate cleavage protein n=1 Tax=Massilia sp. W12 TaxID=3126507 RepID=UPI0030CDF21A